MKKDNCAEDIEQNITELDLPGDAAHVASDTGTIEQISPAPVRKIDSAEAIYQAKQRLARAGRYGPDRPLARLKQIEDQLKKRTRALDILSAPKPKGQGNDLLIYQIDRALNTGNASQTIAERIRRDNLALYASLESSDPIESILNRHLVTMSNGAMECQYRSTFAGNPKYFDVYSRHAERMTRMVIELIEARERRRRPKQVVVGNVNIKAGGQAIVGTVETRKSGSRDEDPSDDSAAA